MNREHKFRAYNNHTGALIEFTLDEASSWDKGEGVYSDQWDIVEYTGLKDRNSVEIYEGDIVTDDSIVDDSGTPFKAEVIFKDGMFRYGHSNCDCGDCEESPLWAEREAIHVIGNIYENPELLGGE